MNIDEAIKFLKNMQNPLEDYAIMMVAAVLHAVMAFILSTDMAKAAAKGEKISG